MIKGSQIYCILTILLFVGVAAIVFSCKPENPCNTDAPTPYSITKPFRFPDMTIPENNPLTEEGIELGRFLFYDSSIAVNKNMSCGTCHLLQYSFSDSGKAVSINAMGIATKRNSPSILNGGYQNHYFFDGRSSTLEAQIEDATQHEQFVDWNTTLNYFKNNAMYASLFEKAFPCQEISKENTIRAMAQFMRTIISSGKSEIDTKFFRTNDYNQLNPAAARGYQIFVSSQGDCFHCHFTNILTTDNQFHNNGLQIEQSPFQFADNGRGIISGQQTDNGKFKTPSLRNVALTPPYMHNGKFNTLREVVDFYADSVHLSSTLDATMIHTGNIRLNLTNSERDDLVAFLETLTDTAVIHDPRYSNPFWK